MLVPNWNMLDFVCVCHTPAAAAAAAIIIRIRANKKTTR